jgi:hypothetical protein
MEDNREGIPAGAPSIIAALAGSAASQAVDRALGIQLPLAGHRTATGTLLAGDRLDLHQLEATITHIASAPQGVACDSIPPALRLPLAWAGLPMVAASPVRFGSDLTIGESWQLDGDRLVITDPEGWWESTSLGIKPLRAWIAHRFQWRVQLAVGVRVWLWPETCVLVNTTHTVISGFLHGPGPGRRTSVALEPGGHTVLAW